MPIRISVVLFLLLAGCNFRPVTSPGGGPDVEGVVIALLPDQRALVKTTYRAGPYPDTLFVNPGAEILIREPNGSVRRGDRTDIRVGDRLRAWLTGVELRSYPPQYPARVVEVNR